MERLLTISKELSQKVESNEGAANELLQQCEELQQKVKAMIQYQNVVQEISGGEDHPRGPPRIEFSYIRQLQQDNSELRSLLEEYEAALEMIMGKYRQQMKDFVETKSLENIMGKDDQSEEIRVRTDEMYRMATVMFHAAKTEDNTSHCLEERLAQLEYENKYLREVLSLSSSTMTVTEKDDENNNDTKAETSVKEEFPATPFEDNVSMTSDTDDSRSSTPKNVFDNDSI